MNRKKFFNYCCLTILVSMISVCTFASGKQIRPPKVDMCEIDPESENCSEEKIKKEEKK